MMMMKKTKGRSSGPRFYNLRWPRHGGARGVRHGPPLLKTPTHACVVILFLLLLLSWTSPHHFVFLFLQSIHHVWLSRCSGSTLSPTLHLVI